MNTTSVVHRLSKKDRYKSGRMRRRTSPTASVVQRQQDCADERKGHIVQGLMTTFRAELKRRMKELGLNQIQLGKILGHRRNGQVSAVLRNARKVPMEDLENWLDALELTPKERQRFWRLAVRDYAPTYVQQLLGETDSLRRDMEKLREEMRELRRDGLLPGEP